MGENADRFITAFNSIEKALKQDLSLSKHYSFIKLVDLCKKRNPLIMKYELDLKKFAELRNAIVHERTELEFIIAEPHIKIVEEIEYIKQQLLEPEKVWPRFRRKVIQFQLSDFLTEVLSAIKEHSFTQYPVYDGEEFVGLITENGLVTWLARHLDKDRISIASTRLDEVIKLERHLQNLAFVSKDTYIYEVKELFVKHIEKKLTRLDAVLITEHGEKDELLIGIITPYDVIKIN